MADSEQEIRSSMLADVLASYEAEYEQLLDRWKSLETKAQGTVAIAGIFLGGIFTFIRDLRADSPAIERWLLIGVALLLTTGILASVLALRVREVEYPVRASDLDELARDMIGLSIAEIEERTPRIYGERFGAWSGVTESVRTTVEEKARRLRLAQNCLLAATFLMLGLSVLLVINLG